MLHFVPFMPMPFLTRVSGLGKQNKERESCVSIGKKNKTKESIPWSLCQSYQPQIFNALSPWTHLTLLSFLWKLSLAALKNSFSRTSFEQKKSLLFCALILLSWSEISSSLF
jgi:hypothetical protein